MSFFCHLFRIPLALYLLFAAAAGSLVFALTMQYGFDIHPCILCLWQRVPFALGAVLALIGILWKPYGKQTRILLGMMGAAFLVNTGLAVFHTGVERHWWLGTSACTIQPLDAGSIEDLRTQLLHMTIARCDQISWTLFGLSMANWNIPFSLGLAVFAFCALMYGKKTP